LECVSYTIKATSETTIVLTFSKPLASSLATNYLTIQVNGVDVPFVLTGSGATYTLTLGVKAESGALIEVTVKQPEAINSSDNYSLMQTSGNTTAYTPPELVTSKPTYQTTAQGFTFAVLILSLLNMDFGSSFHMISQLQLISYAPMGMDFLPRDLKDFLSIVNPAGAIPPLLNYVCTFTQTDETTELLKSFGKD
jgi:hypothetical protein